MLIGVASQTPYGAFFRSMLPVAVLGLVLDFLVIAAVYRRELAGAFPAPAHPRVEVHGFLMAKSLAAALTMLAFFFAGANLSIVALTAGAALLLTRGGTGDRPDPGPGRADAVAAGGWAQTTGGERRASTCGPSRSTARRGLGVCSTPMPAGAVRARLGRAG